jgi:hypothetical protein
LLELLEFWVLVNRSWVWVREYLVCLEAARNNMVRLSMSWRWGKPHKLHSEVVEAEVVEAEVVEAEVGVEALRWQRL